MRTYKQKKTDFKTKWKNFKLVWKYPFLKPSTGYGCDMCYHRPGYRYRYEETWLDEIPGGWMVFMPEFLDRLKAIIKEDRLKEYQITQVKEKWGELCWYDEGGNTRTSELIREFEKRSRNTCIRCGQSPTKYYTKGWITYICEDCANKYYVGKEDKLGLKNSKYD